MDVDAISPPVLTRGFYAFLLFSGVALLKPMAMRMFHRPPVARRPVDVGMESLIAVLVVCGPLLAASILHAWLSRRVLYSQNS